MKIIKLFILYAFVLVAFFLSANTSIADCTEYCSGPNTPIYSNPSLYETHNEQDCAQLYGPHPNGPFTCVQYLPTRTQEFLVGLDVYPGEIYTLQVYSHPVSVVAISGDDNSAIIEKLVTAINATTEAQWNDHNTAPSSGTPGFKPTAEVVGSRPNTPDNRIRLHLNYQNQFGSSAIPVVVSNINCPSYGEAECNNNNSCTWNFCPAEEVITLLKQGNRSLVNKGDVTQLKAELRNLPFNFGAGDNYSCHLVASRDNQPNEILYTFLAPTGVNGTFINVTNTGNNNVYQIICDLNQGGASDEHSSLPVTIKGQSGTLQVSIGTDICTINVGANSCNLPISWTTNYPKDYFNTFFGGVPATNGTVGDYVSTSFSGGVIPHGSQSTVINFSSRNRVDGEEVNSSIINQLASIPITITCAGNSKWNVSSSKCENTPTVTLSASPTTGYAGQINPTITWTTTNNPTSCTASGEANWSGSKSTTGGSQTMGVLNVSRTYTYSLVCANASGNSSMATVNVIVSSKPDLVAGAITPTTAIAGQTVTYSSTITNQGNANTNYSGITTFNNLFQTATGFDDPTIYLGPEGLQNYPASQLMSSLGIGASSNTTSAITFTNAGEYYMRACADLKIMNGVVVSGPIDEGAHENNNCGPWAQITVPSTAHPNLTAGETTPTSAVVNVGRTYTATIRNVGTAGTGASFPNLFQTATGFNWEIPMDVQNYPAPQSMAPLGAGLNSTATSPTITFPTVATYYMRACADLKIENNIVVNGPINEFGKDGDNCGPWSPVEVGNTSTIDLRASDPTPTTAVIGVPMKFTSWISNVGNTGTGGTFYNKFQIASEASGNGNVTVIDSTPTQMPALGPNGLNQAQSINHTFTGSPTTRSVRACADMTSLGNGQITELPASNENNNCSDWVNITFSTVSGNLSASNCLIASGASTCKSSLNWNTINPINGGVSAVTTTPNNTIVRTSLSGSNFLYDISHGSRNFYLYHSLPTPTLLAQAQATATCQVATDVWADGKCNPAGVSSGNLTINPLSCDIAQNESTCTVTGATWTTTNAIQPSLVDENTGTVLSTSANNSDPLRVWVAYPQTDFALRHTGFPGVLDTERVTAKCVNGTSWVDGKCVAILGGLSGSIDASDCTILEGESTCLSNISWSTINPILGETSSVTTPVNITIADENNGDKSYEMDRGSRYFYLYHNGLELGRDESIAECINGTSWVDGKCTFSGGSGGDPIDGLCGYPHNDCDAGTSFDLQDSVNTYMWQCLGQLGGNDSPICTENIVGGGSGDTIDIDFTANPKRIFKGRSSTLRWVTDADSCTGTANDGSPFVTEDKPNGTYIVKPNQTTIYTLSCKKTGVSDASQDAEVKVSVIKFFEI